MKNTWLTWLLGGALLASLHQNLRHTCPLPVEPEPAVEEGQACVSERPRVELELLSLTEEQDAQLTDACADLCGRVDQLEARAEERMVELRAMLCQPAFDPEAVEGAVAEVSDLRRESLELSVQSVQRVRAVLNPPQVEALLECCAPLDAR